VLRLSRQPVGVLQIFVFVLQGLYLSCVEQLPSWGIPSFFPAIFFFCLHKSIYQFQSFRATWLVAGVVALASL